MTRATLLQVVILALFWMDICHGQLNEKERLEEYRSRNYLWPLPSVNPNTTGWDKLMRRRLAQVERVPNLDDRYNGWVAMMSSAVVAPNFTELGWGLTRVRHEYL